MKNALATTVMSLSLVVCSLAQQTTSPNPPPTPKVASRLGIVLPKVTLGQPQTGTDEGAALRTLIAKSLPSQKIEVVTLDSSTPALIAVEATDKHCDYVLSASLFQKKSGGGMGFLRGAAPLSSMIPVVGIASKTSALVTQVATRATLQGVESIARNTKANSEITLDYRLATVAGKEVVAKSDKAKAQTDGQDVITNMILHLVEDVVRIMQG